MISTDAPGCPATTSRAIRSAIASLTFSSDVAKSLINSFTRVRSTDASNWYGCTNPSYPDVVSGDMPSNGRRSTKRAASRIALTIRPFAYPGMGVEAGEGQASSRRRRSSRTPAPRGCRRRACKRRPRRTARRRSGRRRGRSLRPGVNPIRTLPWRTSGCRRRYSAAVTISATPALSSAPSSVNPDAVTMSCPRCDASAGSSRSRSTTDGSSGSTRSRPS